MYKVLKVEMDFRQLIPQITKEVEQRIARGLSLWLKEVKQLAVEYAPRDTGALERGHFARKTGELAAEIGFKFTAEQRENNIRKSGGRRDKKGHFKKLSLNADYFYGYFMHQAEVKWSPVRKGVGPFWVFLAIRDSQASLRKHIGESIKVTFYGFG